MCILIDTHGFYKKRKQNQQPRLLTLDLETPVTGFDTAVFPETLTNVTAVKHRNRTEPRPDPWHNRTTGWIAQIWALEPKPGTVGQKKSGHHFLL